MQTDSRNNNFIEVDASQYGKKESLRVTKVIEGYNGGPCLRFQIRGEGTNLRPGPEIPIEYADKIIQALKSHTE
ncbi:MAG: hypothetical protein ACQEU4_07695 [Bacillota bacterium]